MNNLKSFYERLSRYDRAVFREHIMQMCGWAYGTFYYKMKHGNISKLEEKVVDETINAFLSRGWND